MLVRISLDQERPQQRSLPIQFMNFTNLLFQNSNLYLHIGSAAEASTGSCYFNGNSDSEPQQSILDSELNIERFSFISYKRPQQAWWRSC